MNWLRFNHQAIRPHQAALSLVVPSEESKKIVGVMLDPPWKYRSFLFVDRESDATHWLESIGYRHKTKNHPILYLPLKDFGFPPYPTTNGELYDRLKELDRAALDQLIKFLRVQSRPSGVLFSVPTDKDKRAMGAWWHPKYAHQVYRGARNNRKIVNVVGGFTSSYHSVDAELSARYRREKLLRARVERVDRERLSARTTGSTPKLFEYPVNIVGCGSIGSLAAARLAETGVVDRLRLVDFDKLNIENVARHYCGMSDVGEFKTKATAYKIRQHFPHVECDTHESDVLNLIRTEPISFAPSALTLVAVGVFPVERRLNRLAMSLTGIATPHCYVWVEPHLYGGHALFIRRGGGGCFECAFDSSFLFNRRVIRDSRKFPLREAGCRSVFMPYSGLYANEFVAALIRFLLGAMVSHENQMFSWAGDLDKAKREGIVLGEEWVSAPSFTSSVQKLLPNPLCLICAA